jgi:glycosyltransferase involved in cell wall biosynthesis
MKTSRSVYIIDSFSHHSFHEMFTASFINVCTYIFEDIFYYSCKSTRKCIKNILKRASIGNGKITTKTIFVLVIENKYLRILRYIVSAIVDIFCLVKLPRNELIVYCYNNIFSSPILNKLNKYLNKKVVVFCHGELELLNDNGIESLGPFAKIIKKKLSSLLLKKNTKITKNLIFIVLGNGILSNLEKILPSDIVNSFYAIDHPYIFDDPQKKCKEQNKLSLGTVGVVSKGKNIDQFIHIVKSFLPEIKTKEISFSATGAIYYKRKELLDAHIDIPSEENTLMSRAEFNARIQRLDYILFFYHSKTYKYLASGAVLDAINAEIPIIALKNDYFEYLFSRFGLFGYLVDSIDGMEDVIRKIIAGKKVNLFAFRDIKAKLSPLVISDQFISILTKSGFL